MEINDTANFYAEADNVFTAGEARIIKQAQTILERKIWKHFDPSKPIFKCPRNVRFYLQSKLALLPDERFCAMWLTNRHRVMKLDTLFLGTIDGAAVYPRIVVKRALEVNAGAVVFVHNHPSGNATPSQADIDLTRRLKESLGLIDVRVLDHFIVGGEEFVSMAERELM